jgi:hypothetical protein
MIRSYDITDIFDGVDREKYDWLKKTLKAEQFVIRDDGFLISSYVVTFTDPGAELMYVLRWS